MRSPNTKVTDTEIKWSIISKSVTIIIFVEFINLSIIWLIMPALVGSRSTWEVLLMNTHKCFHGEIRKISTCYVGKSASILKLCYNICSKALFCVVHYLCSVHQLALKEQKKSGCIKHQAGLVAQLDRCPTGDQVADSTLAGSATFFRGDLLMKYFLWSYCPFHWFKKASCQFLGKECAQCWLTA